MTVESNAQEFSAAIEKFAQRLPEIADVVIRKSAADIVAETAKQWPVDTGRSRAAWIAAVSDAETTQSRSTVSITVTNPVNYAPFIEYGTINVAPGGHLQRAIRIVRSDAAEMLAELIQNDWDGAR